MQIGHGTIAQIEADYATLVGTESFEIAAQTLERLPTGPTVNSAGICLTILELAKLSLRRAKRCSNRT